jgi:hypothetical protein
VEEYCRAGQATDDNMSHAHFMLDTWGYKYTDPGCVILYNIIYVLYIIYIVYYILNTIYIIYAI